MTRRPVSDSRALSLILTAALCAGAWMLYDGSRTTHPPQPSAADAFTAPGASGSAPSAGAGAGSRTVSPAPMAPLPDSAPVRIKIPSIRVDAPITPLSLDKNDELQAPDDTNRNLAGWYRHGPTPGTAGNAIIDGHVDTMRGPAVFYLLGALHKGDSIEVDRKDGLAAVFTVDAIEVYKKDAFPSKRVYGSTADPELRLITCGGGYTKRTGYLGNVVLYARLSGSKRVAG